MKDRIRQQFIIQLKKFLPAETNIQEPNNYSERRTECIRLANFYILNCNSKEYPHIKKNKHDFSNLFKLILKQSYTTFPKKDSEIWKLPTFDSSMFKIDRKHEASFSNPIPLKLIDELADQAEEFICKENKTTKFQKRQSYYFYQYLNTYHHTAAENHNIHNLTREKAIEYITAKMIDTHFLARIITYFDMIKEEQSTLQQIIKYYKETALPEAEHYLFNKFSVTFTEPSLLEDSLFFLEDSFQK